MTSLSTLRETAGQTLSLGERHELLFKAYSGRSSGKGNMGRVLGSV